MVESDSKLHRYVGILFLILIIVLLLVGLRLGVLAEGGERPPTRDSSAETDSGQSGIGSDERPILIDQSAEGDEVPLPVLSDNSLEPAPIPETFEGKRPHHEFETYIVERGDTPSGIAFQYGIDTETLLGGNPQLSQESSLMQPEMELIILPLNGVLHDVQSGDTLESISAEYGIPVEDIIAYEPNNLEFPYRLYPDTQILVPGAVADVFIWTPPQLSSVTGSSGSGSGVAPAIVGTGTFIFPVSSRNFTQRFWYGHPGIDVALSEGSGVFAADTGTVTFAGWNIYGFGNLIVVNHGNGYETFYGHLSSINVFPGQIVYQGNVIGAVGNTGNSSGPHIHFEIRINGNRDDPCWYVGC